MRMGTYWRAVILLLGVVCVPPSAFADGLKPRQLRCEYQINPLGVDRPRPRISWILVAEPGLRGKKQTAYQVLVASGRELLQKDRGDQWDTGRVSSSESLHIPYGGRALESNRQYFWKVRVWDEAGDISAWSEPAMWTTGLLDRSEWRGKWITDPDVVVTAEQEAAALHFVNSGFQSAVARDPNQPKWVGVDLGSATLLDSVRLFPATRFDFQEKSGTVSFPVRFRIELANREDFSDAGVVADFTSQDFAAPAVGGDPASFAFVPTLARYVRVYVTRLSAENELFSTFALAELEAVSEGKNLARGKPVIALDSHEAPGWSKRFLTDGRIDAVRRKEVRQPVTWMRKPFRVTAPVVRATVFITARGIYELHLNGQKIGDRVLPPEWTSYHRRSQYQAYDVTPVLRSGENVIGAVVSHAWYAGRVGLMPARRVYGKTPELLVHLEVEHADGRRSVVGTDESWVRTSEGPIVSADIYDGETYDARKAMPGWDLAGFDDSSWKPASLAADGSAALTWQSNDPIRRRLEIKPIAITEPNPGVYVFDLGQNMVGRVQLRIKGPVGTAVKIRHAEALKENGELYTDNLRDAWQIDRYVKGSDEEEIYEPHFTYHGFRYVELTGLADHPSKETITGIVFHSAAPEVGEFSTSSDFVNKLHSIILWTQRANMEGIPTDCPQRPERLGWTGDIQAYAQAAMFNMEMAAFLNKFLRDMRDDQESDGRFPDIAPNPFDALPSLQSPFRENRLKGSPGWADAGTILPWTLWVNYGDRAILDEHYQSAKAWVDYVHRHNPDLLWRNQRGLDPGDWLNGDTLMWPGWPQEGAAMPLEVHATAFFAHSTDLVARMAAVLGRNEEALHYKQLFQRIQKAFNTAYVDREGKIRGDTQGGYALALHFDLLPAESRSSAIERIFAQIERYNGHLSTGFQSTHRLMLELSRAGRSDEAYRLLMARGFPSWALMIENGATTIWERWDGYVKGRGFQVPGMNSFNHYAFGAVDEWMWRMIVGINPDEQNPAYRHFFVAPKIGGGLTWARGTYNSIRGPIRSGWRIDGERLVVAVSIPPNTSATVQLPVGPGVRVLESGRGAEGSPGVSATGTAGVFRVVSGEYEFVVEPFTPPARTVTD